MVPNRYDNLSTTQDYSTWKFTSTGTKGSIDKYIIFQNVDPVDPTLFNCGFGELDQNGTIDDKVRSKNGDMDKVLGTIAYTIIEFLKQYPENKVYLVGSCPIRTRKYQMEISTHLEQIETEYVILGHFENQDKTLEFETFMKNRPYKGFLVTKLFKKNS